MFKGKFGLGSVWFLSGAFTVLVGVFCLQGCSHRGDVLAIVNGHPIGMKEFYEYLQNKPNVNVRAGNGSATLAVDGSLGYQAVRDVIEQNAALEVAKDKGLTPTPAEVNTELNFRLKQNPGYLSDLLARGLTLDVVKQNITVDLAQENLLTQGVTVSGAETDAYIKNHPKDFTSPEEVELSLILVANQKEEAAVDTDLNGGSNFGAVAGKFSRSPGAATRNGKFTGGPVPIASLPAPLQKKLGTLGETETTDWIKVSEGYAKFRVDKREPARLIVLDAAKKEIVHRALMKAKGSKTHNLTKMILTKLMESKVEMIQPQYSDAWKAEMAALKEQAKH